MPLDFTKASVTLDFAEKAAAAAVETFELYHTEDLPATTAYTPADEGLFSASLEEVYAGGDLWVELQTGEPAWEPMLQEVLGNDAAVGDGTNLRFYNSNATLAAELTVMRHHISTGTYERYYTADMAFNTKYTPADEGFFSHASEDLVIDCEYQYSSGNWDWWAVNDRDGNEIGTCLAIGDGVNLRYNARGARWVVIMRAIMVT